MKVLKIVILSLSLALTACGQNKTSTTPGEAKSKTTTNPATKTEAEWKASLTKEQYFILREKGTEAPYSGKWLLNKEKGVYKCAACGNELFTDDMKFDSECGWPSFDKEIAGGKIKTAQDNSNGMQRTEIMCAKCGGHLGHLFNDGPTETGMRYCVNSVSLEFVDAKSIAKQASTRLTTYDTVTLGGGCYWCVEAVYEELRGVISVESGFSGGITAHPTYSDVCSGSTNHAEVVQIVFDSTKTSFTELLKVFFTIHDPTTLNRQGADIGTQYRSVIFYRNNQQLKLAKTIIAALNKEKVYEHPVVTQLEQFKAFYKAEDYHQDYFTNNKEERYCKMVIQPKLEKFEKVFKDQLK